jgi:hypothetical protein
MTPAPTQAARIILGSEARAAGSSPGVATRLVEASGKLTAHLSPVIGELGMHAIYGRALVIAAIKFPWLKAATGAPREQTEVTLRAAVEGQPIDIAFAGAVALLAQIISLLGRVHR